MYCLWCHEEIIPDVTWKNLFQILDGVKICNKCNERLPFIKGSTCPHCSRPSLKDTICEDCKSWQTHPTLHHTLQHNFSIFSYTPFMKEMMSKWKYRGDYELIHMFQDVAWEKFRGVFGKKDVTLVPIPLSSIRYEERGFNQAEAIASLLRVPMKKALTRVRDEKQAKKSRQERLHSENPFQLVEAVHGHVVIVDDLYTTGTTIRWAATLLKDAGAEKVDSFTLIRS